MNKIVGLVVSLVILSSLKMAIDVQKPDATFLLAANPCNPTVQVCGN